MVDSDSETWGLAIHGGAGTLRRDRMQPEREEQSRHVLLSALSAGSKCLEDGGAALDAVQLAVEVLEDSPLFNAGKGSVLNAAGEVEMDAAIMSGTDLAAGAVAGVRRVRNAVALARMVLERSQHVLLIGSGAEEFAKQHDVALEEPHYFITDQRRRQLAKAQAEGSGALLDHEAEDKYGTVGAVARDRDGNLAAATSTGGLTNKTMGRVGDSALIGAGTYANNASCAVSGTGTGEHFIRTTAGRQIAALMELSHHTLASAARRVVHEELPAIGGEGGVVAIDHHGNVVLEFNTAGMYRGFVGPGSEPWVGIFGDD